VSVISLSWSPVRKTAASSNPGATAAWQLEELE
jgi:hypothetical protein